MDSTDQVPALSLLSSAMDIDVTRRTPSPVPSLGHDSLNTPTTEMTAPPSFSYKLALPTTVKGNEDRVDVLDSSRDLTPPSEPSGTIGSNWLQTFGGVERLHSAGAIKQGQHMPAAPIQRPQSSVASGTLPTTPLQTPQLSFPRGTPDFLLIYCFDIERAADFYCRCFGWKFYGDMNARECDDPNKRQWGSSFFDEQPMNFFNSSANRNQFVMNGALIQMRITGDVEDRLEQKRQLAMAGAATPTCHIRVPDLGMAEDLIERNRGEVKHLRYGVRRCIMDIGEFIDSEGNLVGLISLHPENATGVRPSVGMV
ncbi:hypothetical protein FZEAL_4248 [Fusarium zealandicum]|uniref:Uncharacterized protein n=1 Tax=Fusarium zealandicum TaxID=1053134 RepID=A0A8H4UMM8_9HYPO|nr:hypothetical protein FZEAL_4248 [Fusarium zealandicum]